MSRIVVISILVLISLFSYAICKLCSCTSSVTIAKIKTSLQTATTECCDDLELPLKKSKVTGGPINCQIEDVLESNSFKDCCKGKNKDSKNGVWGSTCQ
jgi:hypothetical protein